jgi:DNA-binding transcriptional ArsR family regulator
MQPEALQNVVQLYKLFLDENRLKILGSLAQEANTVHELARVFGLKEPLVSRHLIKLLEAGLVHSHVEDRQTWYELDLEFLHGLKKDLFAYEAPTSAPSGEEDEADKVLRSYLEGERLTQIPAKHSKRMILLAWLADKFEIGMKYPEKIVNEMLKQYHPDCASLRRALVDHGFMQREGGVYWRIGT